MGGRTYDVFSWQYDPVKDEEAIPPLPDINFDENSARASFAGASFAGASFAGASFAGASFAGASFTRKSADHQSPPPANANRPRSQSTEFANAVLRELRRLNRKTDQETSGRRTEPLKRYYIDTANTIVPLATFAGGITIATQFIIQCPHSRLEALLGMASQLFLATPLALMPVYLLLYGKDDKDNDRQLSYDDQRVSYESSEYPWCCSQLCVAGVLLSAAFILLGTAIYVAETDGKTIGSYGLVLLGFLVGIGLTAAVVTSRFSKWRQKEKIIWPSVWRALALFIPQMVVMGLLLGIGGRVANNAPVRDGCTAVQA